MADARHNETKMTAGTYIIMQDVDRYNDDEYMTEQEAVDAIDDIDEPGMWVGYVEDQGDGRTEIMFCCGDAE